MRLYWIPVAILCGCTGATDLGESLASGSASGYDVVLITLDTTRADHLGSYGYGAAETPNLDRLASEGIRFADAVSPAPLTLPSHASILTGLDPQNHGVRNNGQFRLDPSRVTLAEVLKEKGYETAAFVSGFVLDARYGLSQGFDLYDDETEPLPGQPFGGLGERSAQAVTDRALGWLRSRDESRPIFLWVHYYDPHAEYRSPEAFARRFQNPYDGEIAFMDSQVGRLLSELESERARLLVIVAGDHGESLGEHSEYAHSRLVYEATQHVPLFVWSPSIVKPRVVAEAVVGLVDIFPTVLDLAGIPSEQDGDGISLRRAGENPGRAVYFETMAPYLDAGWAPLHGLRRRTDKYILAPRPEYYDLASDPDERKNLYATKKAAWETLAEELHSRLKDTPSAEAIAKDAAAPDPETLRRLQALGYLSGPGPAAGAGPDLPDPKDMMPLQRILIESRSFRREGRLEEALARASEARKFAPKDLEVLEENGLVFIEMNRLPEAEEALRAYTALKPNPNILMLLAEILAATGRRSEGEILLQQAMELEPDHGGVMITWGDFLAARGKYGEAMSWYRKAKEVDPYRATAVADRRIVELRQRASGS
jgi:arylsulfatase A-like enzyme/Flp pilus assembly protein TadD